MPAEPAFTVAGRVVNLQGTPLPGVTVRVYFRSPETPERQVGPTATTDERGKYQVELTADDLQRVGRNRQTVVFVRGFDGDRRLGESDTKPVEGSRVAIDLLVDAAPKDTWLRVFGTVRGQYGEPLDGVVVEAFDRDMRHEQPLGKALTSAGRYEVRYTRAQFRKAEKGTADIVVKVHAKDGKELYKTPVHFNVPDEYELNVTLGGGEFRGPSEWETLTGELTPLLEGVAPRDLREDEAHQDVSFLAAETGRTTSDIVNWMLCYRLADKTAREKEPLPAEVFFAFLRQGQPAPAFLLQDLQHPDRVALLEDQLLRGITDIIPDHQRALFNKSLADNLVPARLAAQVGQLLDALHRLKVRYAADVRIGGGKGTVGQLLALTPAVKDPTAFLTAFVAHTGPLSSFWKTVEEQKILRPEVARQVRLTFELGALTRNHVPLVGELTRLFAQGQVKAKRELAKFSKDDWKKLFDRVGPDGQPVGVPANMDGDTPEAKKELFATILDRQFERAYPTTSFAAKLRRTDSSPVPRQADVVRFLDANPKFHLDRHRIDHYLADNKGALPDVQDSAALLVGLKAAQRVFKLNPTLKAVDAVLGRNIDSSRQIYFMGRGQFAQVMKDSGLNGMEVKRMYRKAEQRYAAAVALIGEYNLAVTGPLPHAVPGLKLDADQQARITALPNLRTLFGSLDYCECSHCRSVYSPAAHFVDVLRFLGERKTNGTGVNAGKTVQDVLLRRRPDIGDIELSCENTSTPLPYIDLANEVLEDVVGPATPVTLSSAILPDLVTGPIRPAVLTELTNRQVPVAADATVYAPDSRGLRAVRDSRHAYQVEQVGGTLRLRVTRQTFLSADELSAHPEYTNAEAYTKLRSEVFPLRMPFDLWHAQTRAYLTHLGVPFPRLLELFQQTTLTGKVPTDEQIDWAWLGLTETERKVMTGTLPSKQAWQFWGLAETGNVVPDPGNLADPTAAVSGTWDVALASVNVFLHRGGLEYRDLLQLLDTMAVNPAGDVFLLEATGPNAAECDTTNFTLQNLTPDVLTRAHRFLRLWRKLGCAMWELDLLLPDADPAPNVTDKPITPDVLRTLSQMNRARESTGLDWATVHSLYHPIDHTPVIDRGTGAAVQTLYERLFRNKLVDPEATFPPSPDLLAGPITDKVTVLLAALRVSEADLTRILDHLSLATTDPFTHQNLSAVHRVVVLARAVSLSVESYLRLRRLWNADPFADPAATWRFLLLAEYVAASAFTVPELDYLLAHQFSPTSGVAFDDKAVVSVLTALRGGLQQVNDDVRKKPEETAEAFVTGKLGRLPALAADADQKVALGIIDGTWTDTVIERNKRIDALFAGVLDLTQAKTKLAALDPTLSPADRQTAVNQRFEFVQPGLELFLFRTQTDEFVRQKVAEALALNVPIVTALLDRLDRPTTTVSLLRTINDDQLIARHDGTYVHSLDEASFPGIFVALRLLHKVTVTVGKLKMTADEVDWWLTGTRAADMGWVHPKEFPTDTTAPVPVAKWQALDRYFRWKADLPVTSEAVLEFAADVLDPAIPAAGHLPALAALTGWPEQDLKDLAAAFGWADVKQALRQSERLVRLADCVAALRRLGVTAARALSWATAEPGETTADGLKQAVKAKYDLPQWLQVIRPIQDALREQKRDALVGWLTSLQPGQPQQWPDADSLYAHFLIDVQMCACMPTSRLKQATAAAQLFVQRCLLNLEPDLLAKADLDPKWKQWKWMKRYRVWEANRKVFLYPENWIEPELRDEKTPFFKDLENELQQNEVTADAVEQAYLTYLEKLDKVANLEIRAMFQEFTSQNESFLHVFGRQRSSIGAEHFYRRQINGARWTAWEKVDPDISGNHLVAGIHNRRLHLFWPQFIEKAVAPTTMNAPNQGQSDAAIPAPTKYWEVRLFWSEKKEGKWTPKVLADAVVLVYQGNVGGDQPENVDFRTRFATYIQVWQYDTPDPAQFAPIGNTYFAKIGRQVSRGSNRDSSESLIGPPDSRFADNMLLHSSPNVYFYNSVVEDADYTGAHTNAASIRLLRNAFADETHTVIDSAASGFSSGSSFFVWDSHRTYFVEYVYRVEHPYYSRPWIARTVSSFRFFAHYHPFVELFIKELNVWGVKGLLNRRIQVDPASVPGSPAVFDFNTYKPDFANVDSPLPVEDVDFDYEGAYAPYNWELFFHVPFYIACKLTANQRFEEALDWFHYIFDPTSTDTTTPDQDTPQQKYWITKPFYERTTAEYRKQKIESILLAVAKGDAAARAQVQEWRDNPFNPHLIARMRTVAYQKNVVIKYVQMLIAWGDQLFRQDTTETMNEATQLYVLAASVLGPRPKSIPKAVPNPVKTFYQLEQEEIDDFGNVLNEVENILPAEGGGGGVGDDDTPELPRLDVLYFCIPHNDKLLGLWDTVADRLYKLRHCLNIEGVFRVPALFDPPIDPAALVRAAAAGLDIGAALGDLNAPLPLYRFTVMIQRAIELTAEVKSLGAAMLSVLEKRDAEGLALLRSANEKGLLAQVRQVKLKQVDEAVRGKEALEFGRKVTEERQAYYAKLVQDGLNTGEVTGLALTGGAIVAEIVATVLNAVAAGTSVIPQIKAGASGFGGSPVVTLEFGGEQVSKAVSIGAAIAGGAATALQMGAGMATTLAGYARRADEWDFQKRLAEKELPQIDKQIATADLRREVADQELKSHDVQIENADKEDEYLRTKFTNQELYDWTIGQLATIYFQTYRLAHDAAKRAERCFRYELGLSDTGYIQPGYWDTLKKGLLCGEQLYLDLKRLEAAYYEQNRREYELTKHVSIAQLDPVALLKLRRNGECFVEVPETAFDMDYPGHYFRRLKIVSLSIPCTAGPYTTVACTLTLTANRLRTDATLLGGKYERDTTADDPRFRDDVAAVQSITTSSAQTDDGLFELNFRDERYLPFEGAGAISSWHLKLNKDLPQFDFNTITDVVLHLGYTAREGGALLGSKAAEEFNKRLNDMALADSRRGQFRLFDLKREFSVEWHRFLYPAKPADGQKLVLTDLADRLPFHTRQFNNRKAQLVEVIALMADGGNYEVRASVHADLIAVSPDPTYQGLHRGVKSLVGAEVPLSKADTPASAWTLELRKVGAPDFKSLPADAVRELFLLVNYTLG